VSEQQRRLVSLKLFWTFFKHT